MSENYFKYLTHSEEDENSDFYLTVGGYAHIQPNSAYPPKGHPSGYHFDWKKGRVLHEYQINYITEGEGILETQQEKIPIREGSIILIRPNTWHRYKPMAETGWKEHYIGFNSGFATKFIETFKIFEDRPIVQIGSQEKLLDCFFRIFNFIKSEKPGYQQLCSGLVIYLLGFIVAIRKNENFRSNELENAIQKACLNIRDNLNKNINVEKLADSLHINYSIFRKAFKKYTGLSPLQYHLSLRIQQATYLLGNSNMSIKEISFHLGFENDFYFRKLFKGKMKVTPGEFRRKMKIENKL